MEASQWRESVRNKKILVLGLAKTGISVAKHLQALGAIITVNDAKPLEENKDAQALIEENNARVVAGGHPVSLLDEDFALWLKTLVFHILIQWLSVPKSLVCPYTLI